MVNVVFVDEFCDGFGCIMFDFWDKCLFGVVGNGLWFVECIGMVVDVEIGWKGIIG